MPVAAPQGASTIDTIFDVLAVVRWLHFGALFVLFGGSFFRLYASGDGEADAATCRFGRRCRHVAAPVALLTGLGWLGATIANMTGGLDGLTDPQTLDAFFFETRFGPIEVARMAMLVVLVVFAALPMNKRVCDASIVCASGLLLVSQAWLGHAAEGGDTFLGFMMIAAYGVHVLAAAAWLGGLPFLLHGVATSWRSDEPTGNILTLLSRFSLMATFAVALIVTSGVANAAFHMPVRAGALLGTQYGEVLVAKVTLVGLMLVCAAYSRFVAMPSLRSEKGGRFGGLRGVATSVGAEIMLGGLVLAAAAVLGITPPPMR